MGLKTSNVFKTILSVMKQEHQNNDMTTMNLHGNLHYPEKQMMKNNNFSKFKPLKYQCTLSKIKPQFTGTKINPKHSMDKKKKKQVMVRKFLTFKNLMIVSLLFLNFCHVRAADFKEKQIITAIEYFETENGYEVQRNDILKIIEVGKRKQKVLVNKEENPWPENQWIYLKTVRKKELTGDIIDGYKLGKVLGSGINGEVFEAINEKKPEEVVAIKRMEKKDVLENTEILRILYKDTSDYFVEIKAVILDEDYSKNKYVVMEFCPSGDLFDFIAGQKLDEETARLYFMQIVEAVAWMHHHLSVVHLDLKLENILVAETNKSNNIHLKLTDFDKSYYIDKSKKPKNEDYKEKGTKMYKPSDSEPFNPSKNPKKWDVWSLGAILHVLLFDAEYKSTNTITEHHLSTISKGLNVHVSDEAKDLLEKMLEKDPNKRIDSLEILNDPWIQKGDIHGKLKNLYNKLSEEIKNELSKNNTTCNGLARFFCLCDCNKKTKENEIKINNDTEENK